MMKEEPLRKLINESNRILNRAVDEGIHDNQPPEEMLQKLRNDVFVFSGFRTHAQLREASDLLVTGNGKIKPFSQFSRDVQAIHKTYNRDYLEAEYQFAIGSAEMASKWAGFEADGDRYNLQYRTAGDSKVRDAHAALANTTLPVSDPFWDSYLPPNGWRCRCVTVQVRAGKYPVDNSVDAIKKGDRATTSIDKKGNNRDEMFRFNPGKQQVIFPPQHPYRKAQEGVGKIINGLLTNATFETVKDYKNGGYINVHRNIDRHAGDYSDIVKCCDHFAKAGKQTDILPRLHPKSDDYKRVYKDLIGTKYEGKSPDFRVDGVFYEYESHIRPSTKDKVRKMISRGLKQSSRVVIDNTEGATDHYINKTIINRIKAGQSLDEVWIFDGGSIRQLYKKQ